MNNHIFNHLFQENTDYKQRTLDEFRNQFAEMSGEDVWYFFLDHKNELDESFLREFRDTLGHHVLTDNVSTDFIRESSNKIREPFDVPIKNKSEKFYEEFKDHVDWNELFARGELKGEFIEKWKDRTDDQAIEFKRFMEEILFNLN